MLLLNLILALMWLLLTGQFTPGNFVFGFVLSYLLLWLFHTAVSGTDHRSQGLTYFRKVGQILGFGLFFLKELIVANLQVASDILRRHPRMAPAVVKVPIDNCSDGEITMLANFITLTPGTLSLDVVDEQDAAHGATGRVLYVHAMYAGQTTAAIARFQQQLQQRYVRRVQEVWQ